MTDKTVSSINLVADGSIAKIKVYFDEKRLPSCLVVSVYDEVGEVNITISHNQSIELKEFLNYALREP